MAEMQARMRRPANGAAGPKSIIPLRYASAQKSGLKVVVTDDPGENSFLFEID